MFGVHNPPEGLTFKQMKEICTATERQGYDIFTITDHLYPMRLESPGYPLECWSTLAGLAATTEKIKLGSLVSCVLYRNPALLGKIATAVDIISNGRLILGIGAGWHESEFKAYFNRFPPVKERMDALEDSAQILRRMFSGEASTTFSGKLYHVDGLVNEPHPVQTRIPLMIGGGGEKRTLRIAARYGDISHMPAGNDVGLVERKIEILKGHCRRAGRNFSDITVGVSITPIIEKGRFSADTVRCIETCLKLGVKIFTLRFSALKGETIETQERFAKEVMYSFKSSN